MLYNPLWKQPKNDLLAAPSLAGLAYLLRHQELWPEYFAWDWYDCQRCAMGLAVKYWGLAPQYLPSTGTMAKLFGINECDAANLFVSSSNVMGWKHLILSRAPNPNEVAHAIEKLLRKKRK